MILHVIPLRSTSRMALLCRCATKLVGGSRSIVSLLSNIKYASTREDCWTGLVRGRGRATICLVIAREGIMEGMHVSLREVNGNDRLRCNLAEDLKGEQPYKQNKPGFGTLSSEGTGRFTRSAYAPVYIPTGCHQQMLLMVGASFHARALCKLISCRLQCILQCGLRSQ